VPAWSARGLAAVKGRRGRREDLHRQSHPRVRGDLDASGLAWSGAAWTRGIRAGGRWSYGSWATENAPGATIDPDGIIHVFSARRTDQQPDPHIVRKRLREFATLRHRPGPHGTIRINISRSYSTPAVVIAPRTGEFDLYFKGKDARLREARYRFAGAPLFINTWSVSDAGEPALHVELRDQLRHLRGLHGRHRGPGRHAAGAHITCTTW